MADLIYTIEDSDEEVVHSESGEEEEELTTRAKKAVKSSKKSHVSLEQGFEDLTQNGSRDEDEDDGRILTSRGIVQWIKDQEKDRNLQSIPLEERIAHKLTSNPEDLNSSLKAIQQWNEEEISAQDKTEAVEIERAVKRSSKLQESSTSEKQESFISVKSFDELHLSKPLLKSIRESGFSQPTPVQSKAIPEALKGNDVLVNAVTGSGKTAAFILPALERLLHVPRSRGAGGSTRVLFLCPTRELAAQCFEVVNSLSRYSGIGSTLVVGGLSEQRQAVALRQRPDIVVATPGRLLDHLLNTQSVDLEDVEILVLDEADRLLEMGFVEEVEQIIKMCPRGRQTMLFSATLTPAVDKLAELALNAPKRIIVDPLFSLVGSLTQEFVRVRKHHDAEENRLAIITALCLRTFKSKVIVFFPSKKLAHRARIVFGLLRLQASELHGDLTQAQRLEALELFKEGKVDYLLCTDLAARGLDIKGVKTVINYAVPRQLAQYVHRVGRTARAGRGGHAVTLIGDADHKMLAEILKRAPQQVKRRKIPEEVITEMTNKLESLEQTIQEILEEERTEKSIRIAEMEAKKTENMMLHEQEIHARPAKVWFMTEKEKKELTEKTKSAGSNASEASISTASEKASKVEKKKSKQELREEAAKEQKRMDILESKAQARKAKKNADEIEKSEWEKLGVLADKNDDDDRSEDESFRRSDRYSRKNVDSSSFDMRYKDAGKEDSEDESLPVSKKRKKGKAAFKSKKRYKRRS